MARLDLSDRWKRVVQRGDDFTSATLIRIVNKVTRELRDLIVHRFMGGARTTANRLRRNTGKMEAKTVARRATATEQGVSASIAINVPYASVHFSDDGRTETVIRPKRKQALAVPFVVGPDHRPILPASSSLITKKFTFGGMLWGRLPGKKTQPLFLMRNSVTVPARINVKRDIQPLAEEMLSQQIEAEFKKRFR